MKIAALALLLALQTLSLFAARPRAGAKRIDIRTLSTRADRVSGGDVLIAIVAPGGTAEAVPHGIAPGKITPGAVLVTLNGRDVSSRLRTIFPGGSCDFSKPGVNQTRVVPWAAFGPAPENLVFDRRQHKTSN